MDILRREFIYVWYYFSIQLEQIFGYWVLGMVLGSAVSVFGKYRIHSAFSILGEKRLGVLGLFPASLLGIASPLCMYGTIPIAASFCIPACRFFKTCKIKIMSVFIKTPDTYAGHNPTYKTGYKPYGHSLCTKRRTVNEQLRVEQDRTHHKSSKHIVFHPFL